MGLSVFVDFDGTVTREDVGNAFFLRFCGDAWHDLVDRYRRGEISAREYYTLCAEAAGEVDAEAVESFLVRQEIDPAFPPFAEFCAARGVDLAIVSDGLDHYIGRILQRHGVNGVPFYANSLVWLPGDGAGRRLAISFPHADGSDARWACSKRNIIVTRAGEDDVIAYVGEGYSDRSAVEYADIVFAKDSLQTYCQEHNISYHLYASFRDVQERLAQLLERPRLRKRREAEMKRRALFTAE
jgi:2,3-diketo-5-methylthio-1-phosphopentane phosphatase